MRTRRNLRPTIALVGALLLSACGAFGPGSQEKTSAGGGGDAPPSTQGLAVPAQTLPLGHADAAYGPTQLVATGATGDVVWTLGTGRLPAGIDLHSDGTLSGAPSERGIFDFQVRAADDRTAVVQALRLGVDALYLDVSGLRFGDAWSGTSLVVTARGQSGAVRFQVLDAPSGGRLGATDAATAVYVPGSAGAIGCTDRIRATDDAGASAEVALHVMPNAEENHVASFSGTDVWMVDFNRKVGTHPFARDFDEALAAIGMRGPTSYSADGNEADLLASFLVRREVLRRLNVLYLRDPDGGPGANGLPITFPMEEPVGFQCPPPGGWLSGAPWRYGVMSVLDGVAPGLLGLAWQDGATNATHENDTTTSAGSLGVFVNRAVVEFNFAWQNQILVADPIGPADVATLRALVYFQPTSGARADEIVRITQGFGQVLGTLCAHEIGHSVGLAHTIPTIPGSVMNGSATILPSVVEAFLPDDIDRLRTALPGVGRSGAAKPGPALLPEGGVEACGLAAPVRRLPPWAVRSTR
jgi:hypothetical protein